MSEWTEGVCSNGAAILRDGQPVTISELLEHLNRCESIRSAALEEAAKVAETWGKREAQITDTAFIPAADNGEQFASVGIASAIRSLKDKP